MKIAALLAAGLVCSLLTAAAPQDGRQDAQRRAEAAFAAARAVSPTPLRLAREHRDWLQERAMDGSDVAGADEDWAGRWTASAARDARVRSLAIRPDRLPVECVDIGISGCATPTGGYLNIRGERLMWQLQDGFTEEDGKTAGYVLLTGVARLRAEAWGREGVWYAPPKILWIADQAFIGVAGAMAGTGAFNADALYRFTPGADHPLTEIDNQTWRDVELPALLPPGLEIWKGVAFNYDVLIARTSLWRPSDANCCPSGGEATLSFEIVDDRLVLVELRRDDAP
jgi:hypothetical protein